MIMLWGNGEIGRLMEHLHGLRPKRYWYAVTPLLRGGAVIVLSFALALPMSATAFAQITDPDVPEVNEIAPAFILERYRVKAEAGDVAAQFRLGILYERGMATGSVDLDSAAHWYGRAAEGGHLQAKFKRARFYEDGLGGPRDLAAATGLYRAAAERGMAEAQYNLAIMLHQGIGTSRDISEAIRWYEQAAFRGIVPAMQSLGLLYLGGVENRPQDDIEAWAWLSLAIENGDPLAARYLPEVAARMDDAALTEAARLADAYRQLRLHP